MTCGPVRGAPGPAGHLSGHPARSAPAERAGQADQAEVDDDD